MLVHATDAHPDLPMPPIPSPAQTGNLLSSYGPQSQQDRRVHNYPQQPFPSSATAAAGLFPRTETSSSGAMNFARKTQPGQAGYVSAYNPPASPQHSNSVAPGNPIFESAMDVDMNLAHDLLHDAVMEMEGDANRLNDTVINDFTQNGHGVVIEEREESRESTPASPPYPKPGTGLMSRLKTDEEDLEWLVGGDEDDIAFSHTVLETGVGA